MSDGEPKGKTRPSRIDPTLDANTAPAVAELVKHLKDASRAVLRVIAGNELGRCIPLQNNLVIGRDPGADLTIADPLVSSHHARVEDRGDSWAVVDLGSRNGTLVNGQPTTESVLVPFSTLTVGSTVFRFELQDGVERQYSEMVEHLLNIDDLSGLFVRRKFDAELRTMIESARLAGRPLGLLVMDLDGIKQINDTHGHLYGAYAIGESGKLIGNVIRPWGIGSRFGGDEFVAALADRDLEGTAQVGEEIRATIGNHSFVHEGVPLRVGISIGVASFPASATDADELFRCADAAMYRAKRGGKHRVSF